MTALRIGELSRRSGVSPELLRAWERRYGLLRPTRSAGGLRLYSPGDLARVEAMQHHLAAGFAAAEAAALATRTTDGDQGAPPGATDELAAAVARFDEGAAHAVFDSLLARLSVDTVLRDVVVPYLHELGERWATGAASIAQEHFASALLRGRLLGLARGWGSGVGPRALLACVRGEEHDLGLLCFGLALRARGWRITYLGTDTPTSSLADAASLVRPELVVVNVVNAAVSSETRLELEALARDHRLAVGGSGADESLAQTLGAELLRGDPVSAADAVAQR
jgi:DNA-binding transcriptional MerR regulator